MKLSKEDREYASRIVRLVFMNKGEYSGEEIVPRLSDDFNIMSQHNGRVKMSIDEFSKRHGAIEGVYNGVQQIVDRLAREGILRIRRDEKLTIAENEQKAWDLAIGRHYITQEFARKYRFG